MPIDLALDISRSNTGACWDGHDGRPRAVSFSAPGGRKGSVGSGVDYGRSGAAYEQWLVDLITTIQPRRMAFEAPMQVIRPGDAKGWATSQDVVRLLFGLAFLTDTIAHRLDVPVFEINAATARKSFAGNGHAKKADIMAQCRRLGWEPKDEDQGDAMCVWYALKSVDKSWRPVGGFALT